MNQLCAIGDRLGAIVKQAGAIGDQLAAIMSQLGAMATDSVRS